MELVYLWVEEYKNIKKQGFNFSPRFKCEYDEGNNKLEIIDKEKTGELYPKDFFGKNINITAIVGENGSGKSKLLNSFSSENTSIYCLYLKKNQLYKYTREQNPKGKLIKPTNEKEYNIKNGSGYNLDFFSFNLSNELKDDWKRDPEYIKYYQINENDAIRSFFKYKFINNDEMNLEVLPFYFNPEFISIRPSKTYIEKIQNHFKGSFSEYIKKVLLKDYYEKKYFLNNKIGLILFFIKEMIKINKELENKSRDYYRDFIEECKEVLTNKNKLNLLKQINNLKSFDSNLQTPNEEYLKIEEYIGEFHFYDIEKLKKNKIFDLLIQKKYFELFDFDFADMNQERKLFQLSTGEKYIFSFFINLYEKINNSEKTELILIFDEIEVYLHPNWQKKLINLLISFLKKNFDKKYKFHLLLSSHSPFILSDLPKQNVIFLKQNQETLICINDTDNVNINPFGANIHTLLSHGFFMKDSLIGEFAKSKIQSIIKYHEETLKKELSKEENKKQRDEEKEKYEKKLKQEFWQIQSIIGDDYLKQVIKNHLVEIEKVLYDEYLIDKEIKKLQDEIDRLNRLKK